jgi:hypothetical protein
VLEHNVHLLATERLEVMHKAHARVQLRIASKTLLDTWEPQEDHRDIITVIKISDFLQAIHQEAVGLID